MNIQKLISLIPNIKRAISSSEGLNTPLQAISGGLSSAGISKFTAGFTAVTTAVGLAVSAYNAYKKKQEELRQSALQASAAYQESASSIEGYREEVAGLKESLTSGNLSEQEAYEVRQRLVEIQNEVIEKYGAEAEGINLLTSSLDSANAAFDELAKNEAQEFLASNASQIEKAISKMTQEKTWVSGYLGSFTDKDSVVSDLEEIFAKYEFAALRKIDIGDGNYQLEFSIEGNAEDAHNAIAGLRSDLSELTEESGYALNMHQLSQQFEAAMSKTQGVLDDWQEIYNTAMLSKIADNDSYTGIVKQVNDYVTALQEAILSSDLSAISENLELLTAEDLLSGITDENVREYIQENIIDPATSSAEAYEATIKLNAKFEEDGDTKQEAIKYFKDLTASDGTIDLAVIGNIELGGTGYTDKQINAVNELNTIAEECETTVVGLAQSMAQLGLVTLSITEKTEEQLEVVKMI